MKSWSVVLFLIFTMSAVYSNAGVIYGEINCGYCEFVPGDMVLIQNLETGTINNYPIDFLRKIPCFSTAPKKLPPATYRIWLKSAANLEENCRYFDFVHDGKNQRFDIILK